MKKVTTRSYAAIIVAALLLVGLGVYLVRLASDGGDWAGFYANDSVYKNGALNCGVVTDRNGVTLAQNSADGLVYASSSLVRTACLHAVGDPGGNIGTGALSAFRSKLIGYSFLTGTTTGGGTVTLSIDSDLNATAYNALAGRRGAVLISNYKTGEILCMVSAPAYDPTVGFNESDSRYEGAYINRCISSAIVPGSIFKIVTLATALENDNTLFDQSFYCDGSVTIGGQTINCSGIHGWQTIGEAFAQSCNCAFAELSVSLGGDAIAEYAERYGLTQTHELNGIETRAGSVPSAGMNEANVAWEGIGQYNDLVCPYSMLRLVAAIANGGECVEPTILAGKSHDTTRLVRSDTAAQLASMMAFNLDYEYGADWNFPGLSLAAKTGTAEVDNGASHAWFAGFVTDPDHPYAFVVLVENAGSGLSNAGPVANAVLQQLVSD